MSVVGQRSRATSEGHDRRRRLGLAGATLALLLWLMAACTGVPPPSPTPLPSSVPAPTPSPSSPPPTATPSESVLPFETVEREDHSDWYHSHPLEPQRLELIASAEEAARLAGMVSQEAQQELAQLDYQRYFVIALFRGRFGSSGYDVTIQRVARQGDRLLVYAQFWAPSPHYAVTAAESQPYHVVKVLRDGGPLQAAELQLITQAVTPTPPR